MYSIQLSEYISAGSPAKALKCTTLVRVTTITAVHVNLRREQEHFAVVVIKHYGVQMDMQILKISAD